MDAAERAEHRRYQAELEQRWVAWNRRMKWRIGIQFTLAVLLMAAAIAWWLRH